MGNVDKRDYFRKTLLKEAHSEKNAPCYYTNTVEDVKIIVLDSQNLGKELGVLQEPQHAWLEEQLQDKSPTIIALHHPPFTLQLPDGTSHKLFNIRDMEKLYKIINKSNIVAVLCGHLHQCLVTQRYGVKIIVGSAALSEVLINDKVSKTYDTSGFMIHTIRDNVLTSRPIIYSEGRKLIKTT
jgi:Icc protein